MPAGDLSTDDDAEHVDSAEAAPDAVSVHNAADPDRSSAHGQAAERATRVSDRANGSAMPALASENVFAGELAGRLHEQANSSAAPAPVSEDAAAGVLRQAAQACTDGAAAAELRLAVLAHLHLFAYEFSLADCADSGSMPQKCGSALESVCVL